MEGGRKERRKEETRWGEMLYQTVNRHVPGHQRESPFPGRWSARKRGGVRWHLCSLRTAPALSSRLLNSCYLPHEGPESSEPLLHPEPRGTMPGTTLRPEMVFLVDRRENVDDHNKDSDLVPTPG